MNKNNLNLTYGQLITQILEFKKKFPQLDILDQPVTLTDPQDNASFFNITNLCKMDDGHFSMESN